MKILKYALPLFMVITMAMTCSKEDQTSFENTKWTISVVDGKQMVIADINDMPYVTFRLGEKNEINGFNGCNNFFGEFELDEYRIKMGPLASTRKYCENTDEMEKLVMAEMQKVKEFKMIKDVLELRTTEGKIITCIQQVGVAEE